LAHDKHWNESVSAQVVGADDGEPVGVSPLDGWRKPMQAMMRLRKVTFLRIVPGIRLLVLQI
jgi:hypothetical protein